MDEVSIIDELLYHIERLFEDQKHTHKYNSLTATLEKYDSRFSTLVRSEGGINTDEKFQKKTGINARPYEGSYNVYSRDVKRRTVF